MARQSGTAPSGRDFYDCGVVGSILCFIGLMLAMGIGLAATGEGIGRAILAVVLWLVMGFIPFCIASVLVIGPMAAVIGIGLREWLPPTRWHGAVTGVLTAITLGAFAGLLLPADIRDAIDSRLLPVGLGFLALAAASGWAAQRLVLDWPPRNRADG